jgi:hypothetical protein
MQMIDEAEEKAFLEKYARAMLSWQYVEAKLFFLFLALVRGKNDRIVSAAYHSISGFGARIGMITAAINVSLSPVEEAKEWKSLRKRIEESAGNRNALAHSMALGHQPETGPAALMLKRSIFDTRAGGNQEEYNIGHLELWEREFSQLADDIQVYLDKVTASLPGKNEP